MILTKILAVVLALSQISTRPDAVKTHFEPSDRAEVVTLLRAGCAHMRKVFAIEELQLDDLVDTAMNDPKALSSDVKVFHGINIADLYAAYREFCKDENVASPTIDIGKVIEFYNSSAANLPDHTRLKGLRLAGPTEVLDAKGNHFTELYEPGNRRIWVPLSEIPLSVQQAFIAAEDKRFYQHHGIDERGLVRAFVSNMMQPGRLQGGSTITQQVVKNLLVGDDVTYERKIREILVTSRVEHTLTKQEILQLYLNSIYLGRSSWGIEMAARSYFGKSAKDLDLAEGALLAGLTKGPNYFSPDRAPDRARERYAYVIGRLKEDGFIDADQLKQLQGEWPQLAASARPRPDGQYFFDYLKREAKTLPGLESLKNVAYTVHSTIDPDLQHATEAALQEGLAQYELNTGRVSFQGPEVNLAAAIRALPADAAAPAGQPAQQPAWQRALAGLQMPLADVHWEPAVVIDKPSGRRDASALRVGLRDGRVLPLRTFSARIARKLALYDVIYVRVRDENGRGARADLRVRPQVQGAAVVLDNKTGRILAMSGGFSYGLSQLNRTVQTRRQPGSTVKPFTYLAALQRGLQPNTIIRDEPITLAPIAGSREQDYWSPRSYDGAAWGVTTLRRGLENSRNLATAGLLDGVIASTPQQSLERVCELMIEAQLYQECQRYYPIVLGAQPVRLIDLAAFYAAIANEGALPTPHAIAAVEQDGRSVYRDDTRPLTWLGGADRVSFYQLRTMLQGVLARGTARAIANLAPFVGGKTGTSEDENDAWFVGFTNDVTVAVWIGYDNGDGNGRRTLGRRQTGGKVAVPIFASIVRAVWAQYAPQVALAPPSSEVKRQIASLPIDLQSGDRLASGGRGAFYEQFRINRTGQFNDTQYDVVSRDEADSLRERETFMRSEQGYYDPGRGYYGNAPYGYPSYPSYRGAPYPSEPRGLFGDLFGGQHPRSYDERDYAGQRPAPNDELEPRRPRRVDPDYFWGGGRYN